MIRIIAIGKKHDDWIKTGVERYQKRLRALFDVEWVLLPYSQQQAQSARQEESRAILSRIKEREYVILLDETGKNLSSPELAQMIERISMQKSITFVIGGAYGVDDELTNRADLVWSLSRLVLPHMLVRLVLIEQLYRSQEIIKGGPYHHN